MWSADKMQQYSPLRRAMRRVVPALAASLACSPPALASTGMETLPAEAPGETPQLAMAARSSQLPGGLRQMKDEELADVTGQALFVADEIQGQSGTHGLDQSDTTFYRIGLDATLRFNLNIDKLQMGCGGFNEGLVSNACDLDVDFLRFTGPTGPDDDFEMAKPYLELAIKNDGDRTQREVVGIKIGAASANGVMHIGRKYSAGQVNQEHGYINGQACGSYSGTQDDGSRLACSSGANRMSGFLLGEFSAVGEIGDLGGADVCMGWVTAYDTNGNCGEAQEMFASYRGNRLNRIGLVGNEEELKTYNCGGTLAFLNCPDANFKMSQHLRTLHEVPLTSSGSGRRVTRDFFLSWQRESVAYPIYDQSSPYGTTGPNDHPGDSGADGSGGNSSTWVSSRFSAPTMTGWWMNITYTDVRNLDVGTMELGGLGGGIDALLAGGTLQDVDLGMSPIDNCFGDARFC